MAEDYLKESTGFIDITLPRPAKICGVETVTLRMREPTVSDQLNLPSTGSDAERELALFANLLEITPDDIKALPLRSYRRIQVAFANFIV